MMSILYTLPLRRIATYDKWPVTQGVQKGRSGYQVLMEPLRVKEKGNL